MNYGISLTVACQLQNNHLRKNIFYSDKFSCSTLPNEWSLLLTHCRECNTANRDTKSNLPGIHPVAQEDGRK